MVGSDVHRVFVGFLNLLAGTTTVFRGNIFIDVYTPEVGTYPLARISPDVQATTRLTVGGFVAPMLGTDIHRRGDTHLGARRGFPVRCSPPGCGRRTDAVPDRDDPRDARWAGVAGDDGAL